MRWKALMIAGLVVVSGCLAGPSTDPESSMEDDARDAADDRLEDPELVAVWGIEPPIDARQEDQRLETHLDEAPGDGQAPGWAYRFQGERSHAIVLTASEVGVIAEFYEREDPEDDAPSSIGERSISSEEAADALKANASWPEMSENTTVAWQLVNDTEPDEEGDEDEGHGPVWVAHAERGIPELFEEGLVGVVDARTGEVLEIDDAEDADRPGAPVGGGCDRDASTGQVTPTDSLTASVDLEATGQIEAEATRNVGAGPLNVTLEGPNGTLWATTFEGAGSSGAERSVDDQPPGEYTLTASTSQGVHDVELDLIARWGTGASCPEVEVGPQTAALHPVVSWLSQARPAGWTR